MGGLYILSVVLLMYTPLCVGQTFTEMRDAYTAIYTHYYNGGTPITDIIPLAVQSDPMIISLAMTLDSLNGFDAVKGQIDISGSMKLSWTDQSSIIADDNTEVDVQIDFDKAWSPSLVLLNAVDTVKNIGDTTYKLQINYKTGLVNWQPRVLLRASCTPDVTYYPFDRQTCQFTYTCWGYTSDEIILVITTSEWDMTNYGKNGVWDIVSTKSIIVQSGGADYATFEIIISREPLYFTFNIALPILLLGLLNGFVFLLPAESGERIGFCITCFLSFVVLLQTTMDFMPQISSPMSLLCYYVFIMMCFSVFINIVTILMLRIYHKPAKDKVPHWMQMFVRITSCLWCPYGDRKARMSAEIDWPNVARSLDFFFFLAFCGAQTAFTIFFLVPIATRY